jgi:hypothetical protein
MASISYNEAGGRWMWRNAIPDPDTGALSGSWSVLHNASERDRWRAEIRDQLDTVGYFRKPVVQDRSKRMARRIDTLIRQKYANGMTIANRD